MKLPWLEAEARRKNRIELLIVSAPTYRAAFAVIGSGSDAVALQRVLTSRSDRRSEFSDLTDERIAAFWDRAKELSSDPDSTSAHFTALDEAARALASLPSAEEAAAALPFRPISDRVLG